MDDNGSASKRKHQTFRPARVGTRILIATDGSKPARDATKYVAKLAGKLKGKTKVTLLNVQDDTTIIAAPPLIGIPDLEGYLRDLGEAALRGPRKILDKAEVLHDNVILNGYISEEIVRFAKSGKYDLIVMGSNGYGRLSSFLIGSVAQKVLATASQPVLLVRYTGILAGIRPVCLSR